MSNRTSNVRLSKNVQPIKYNIHFVPDLDNFTFTGEEEILLDIKKSTSKLVLHSAEIEILSIELVQGKTEQSGKVEYKEKEELVILSFDSGVKPGKVKLKISFTGILNDKMRGFYRSRYEHAGKTYHMGVTQFESTDARRAFPGFDEPAQKAIFEVSFKIPEDRTVISNTIESEVLEHAGGYKVVKFTPTPKMSSYLLAFIIGHFESIEQKTKDGTLVRVFVTPGKKKQAEFALDVATKVLGFYADYFKIKYPLPTMDLIAIPDFAAGAMENWGAVTYRETALLVDPDNSSTHNKQWVALVIAHELAHQWFGNLVTMEWWTHLWLNEGFASYMEYVAVDKLFPKWHIWTQFVYTDHATALSLDGLKNTHPIEIDVNHPAEISEIFDEVSYSKGASVIRMLAEYLGETNFRNGLCAYLKKHSYANASTNHLWESLEVVSKKPVKKMMQNWTRKPGYPLVNVSEAKDGFALLQKRFFSSVLSQKTQDTTSWLVPMSVLSNEDGIHDILLSGKKGVVKHSFGKLDWIKLNKNETAFVRVKYSDELLQKLAYPIKQKKIGEQDRFGVVRDCFVLAEAGYATTVAALEMANSYIKEDSYIVWAEIATHMAKLANLLENETCYPEFESYVRDLFAPIGEKLGWSKAPGESHHTTLLRSIVLSTLGRYKNAKTIAQAKAMFKKKNIDPDIRGVVYSLVAENGGAREYEMFLTRYKTEKFQEEKDRILRALCNFTDVKLVQKTLDFAFSDQVKAQDAFKVVTFLSTRAEGRMLAWDRIKKEWPGIVKKFGGGHLYNRFIKPFANGVTEKDALSIESFFRTHESKGLDRTISQITEQIRSNAAWLKRDGKSIQKFLT